MSLTITEETVKDARRYCRNILPQVSRTFALNINVLHGEFYHAVLCSYLLCRIADTFEDSTVLDNPTKINLLESLSHLVNKDMIQNHDLQAIKKYFQSKKHSHPYYHLIQNCEHVFINYLHLRQEFRQAISNCVQEMCQGMLTTLQKQSTPRFSIITFKDLDNYCYYVAGTVGQLLTRLFVIHSKHVPPTLQFKMQSKEVSFGLGLQITNIIKDSYKDYQKGTCYIPVELANHCQLPIEKFFTKPYQSQAIMAFDKLIHKATSHLDDALSYILCIPTREWRFKLFCLYPLLFAIKTLAIAKSNPHLVSGNKPVKISHSAVIYTLFTSNCLFWSNTWIKHTYRKLRNRIIQP